ncbi:AP2/ERF family transcription factor [Bacillus thuringiensis]|nr:AP2/ERF family transcription factor [Bacillus thuringiensis]
MAKEIPLQNDMLAIVDDEDYERVSQYNWTCSVTYGVQIKVRRFFNKEQKLHETLQSFILNHNCKETLITFIDGNQLNFQKENLKITNKKYVSQKRKGDRNTSSRYKGVSFDKSRGKWKAEITTNGKTRYLGRYDNEEGAALAYNKVAIEVFGEHAYQNVIGKGNSPKEFDVKKSFKPRRRGGTSSNYRGVSKRERGVWTSKIFKDGKNYYLGSFQTEIDAAEAYDKKAIELFGDKAILNFPEGR